MEYELFVDEDARRNVKRLDNSTRLEVVRKFRKLRKNPFLGKPLRAPFTGRWVIRAASKYRIIYEINKDKLEVRIKDIRHREVIYD